MPSIVPKNLKKLREFRHLTLEQLAESAGLDKQSIHRLEQGHRSRARESTLTKLAKALQVEKERLTTPPAEGPEAEATPAWEPNKSQLNLRVSGQARNALLLASERYHVKPAQIVELAPFLFYWAAEKCLRQREERLDSLRQQKAEISEQIDQFCGTASALFDDSTFDIGESAVDPAEALSGFDQAFLEEESAIALRYLFNGEYADGGAITDFLAELASELGNQVEFEGWNWDSSPAYSICKEEVERLTNGDEVAIENILEGYAPLHELSKEDWEQLRYHGATILADKDEKEKIEAECRRRTEERVKWLRAHGKPDIRDSSEVAP